MKIIKKGQVPKLGWKEQFTCKKCKSVIEVEFKDLEKIPGEQDGPHYSSPYYICQCPVCKEYRRFSESDVESPVIPGQRTVRIAQ